MDKTAKIALVYGSRIGDGIVGMTLTHNLILNGYHPVTFSDPISELASLFPSCPVRPMQALDLEEFDVAIYPYACPIDSPPVPQGVKRVVFREHPFFCDVIAMRATFARACAELFGIGHFEPFCPITTPWEKLQKERSTKRVVLHTTAHEPFREWGKRRFNRLAKKLKRMGYEPLYLVAPHEKKAWEKSPFPLVSFDSLMDLAQCLAESAFFIGGDSGPGHLAALVGTPTLTLAYRKTVIKRWTPTGSLDDCILPLPILPSSRLRARYWQTFLSPRRVARRFSGLSKLLSNGEGA